MPKFKSLDSSEVIRELKDYIKLPMDPSLRKLLRKTVQLLEDEVVEIELPSQAERIENADSVS